MAIDEDLIVEGAKACALAVGCYGGPGGGYMCSDPLDDNCECGKYTRAALTAILPVVEERERAEHRELLEDVAFQFAYHAHDKQQRWLTTGGLSTLEDIFAVLGWDDPHYVSEGGCEHPGCTAWATCGTPTPDGYKRLCGEHYRAASKGDDHG